METSDAEYHHAVVMRGSKLYWDPEGAVNLQGGRTCCTAYAQSVSPHGQPGALVRAGGATAVKVRSQR